MNIETYSKLAIQYYQSELPEIFLKYLPDNFLTLLDCGCGDGSFLFSLLNNPHFKNKKIIGVDLSTNRIDLINKNFNKQVSAFVDNVETLKNIKNNTIDVLVSQQVIEHVNDNKMIEAIKRVTTVNSYIYISTVIKAPHAWYFYKNSKGESVLDPTHLREYPDEISIIKLFNPEFFHIIEYQKTLFKFPVLDLFFKILKLNNRQIYSNKLLKYLRNITLPIPNYYKFEIVFNRIK